VRLRWIAYLIALAVFSPQCAYAQETASTQPVTIAAASDLAVVMKDLVPAFEKRTAYTARVSFGSSGSFYSQILNGAPFDIFLSADTDYPRRLIAAGVADSESLYVYAVGRLVLWAPAKSSEIQRDGLNVLVQPYIRKLAIANPEHAPYGRAAVAALRQAGIYEQIERKLVLGENVSQAAQFVESGNAEAGLISASLVLAMKATTSYVELKPGSYPAIEQAAVITSSTKNKAGADAFLAFLKSEQGRELLYAHGFSTPVERP
jgi:molybdate transport system substrate-binding protein